MERSVANKGEKVHKQSWDMHGVLCRERRWQRGQEYEDLMEQDCDCVPCSDFTRGC